MACSDCIHLKRCQMLIGDRAAYTGDECDWTPSRHFPVPHKDAAKHQRAVIEDEIAEINKLVAETDECFVRLRASGLDTRLTAIVDQLEQGQREIKANFDSVARLLREQFPLV